MSKEISEADSLKVKLPLPEYLDLYSHASLEAFYNRVNSKVFLKVFWETVLIYCTYTCTCYTYTAQPTCILSSCFSYSAPNILYCPQTMTLDHRIQ